MPQDVCLVFLCLVSELPPYKHCMRRGLHLLRCTTAIRGSVVGFSTASSGRPGPAWQVPPPEDPSGGQRHPGTKSRFPAPPDLHGIRSPKTHDEHGDPELNVPRRIVDDLEQVSEFDRKQIAHLYQHFSHLAGRKGYLTQQDFAVNFHLMGTMDAQICAKYFDLFDRNCNGVINFEEFVLGLGQLFKVVRDDKAIPSQIVKEERDAKLIWTEDKPEKVPLSAVAPLLVSFSHLLVSLRTPPPLLFPLCNPPSLPLTCPGGPLSPHTKGLDTVHM